MTRDVEPLDLDDEVAALAAQRVVRLRHRKRVRAVMAARRTAGVDIRNARKTERLRREREEGGQ